MNYFIIIIAISLLIFLVLHLKNQKEKAEKLRLEKERKRQEALSFFKNILDNIKNANSIHQENLAYKNGYFSNYKMSIWKKDFISIHNSIKGKDYKTIGLEIADINSIDEFLNTFVNISNIRKIRNEKFIEVELKLYSDLFDNIENKKLDIQQRTAIVQDEDNSLVIAGAGSGKTTTIAGKVKYLTERFSIDKNKILLISFTSKSSKEMSDRIRSKMKIDLPVMTFHKLGKDIIAEVNNEAPDVYNSKDVNIKSLIQSFVNNAKRDILYSNKLLDFLTYYLKPYKSLNEFASDAEHNNYLKEQKLEGYQIIEKTTTDGVPIKYRERFKSQEEVYIANFLFRNQIKYIYENDYHIKTASRQFGQYKPDFYLPEYKIYIEHFGIDKYGKVPDWFRGDATQTAQEKYSNGIDWKRAQHKENNTTLIETYSWEQKEDNLITNLTNKLKKHNVTLNPMSDENLWKYLNENFPEDIENLTVLINTFLVLFKSNNENIKDLSLKALKEKDKRAVKFLELFEPIYLNYEKYLKENNKIDFSDMINLATDIIVNNQFVSQYDYIIIDEFQDISKSRYQLIKALLDQKPSTKLFCVGDDWQSIYRFAGSDIGIFTGFEEYFKSSSIKEFNRHTNKSYIENTYRFDNNLIDVSSNFILKNKNQIIKSLISNKNSNIEPIILHKYNDSDKKGTNKYIALDKSINDIIKQNTDIKTTILFLGRYEFDYKVLTKLNYLKIQYNNNNKPYKISFINNNLLKLKFMTVHSAKGLEADYVIILNGNSGTYGFPSEISDDPLLNFLLSKADQFPNGEERRLFYVALTRAKKQVHILSSIEYSSKFVNEIKKNEFITALKCDWCDNGKLIERNGPHGPFFACNNFHYCTFTRSINIKDYLKIAQDYTENKDFDKAIENYKKAIELDNSIVEIHLDLAFTYRQNNQLKEAINEYNISINIDSTYAISYFLRGITYYFSNEYQMAINDFIIYNNLKPNTNNIYYWLSIAYYKLKLYTKSLDSINKELELYPDNENAIKLKNKILASLKIQFSNNEQKIKINENESIKGYIDLAINLNINIKFNYHKSVQFEGGIQSLRTIKPTGFKTMGQFDSICVYGYCYMRNEERTFNLERISDLILNPNNIEFWEI